MQPYTPATKCSGPRPPQHSKQHAGQPLLSPTCERRTESRTQTHRMAAIRFQCALGSNFAGHGDSAQTDPQSRVVQRGQAAYSQQGRHDDTLGRLRATRPKHMTPQTRAAPFVHSQTHRMAATAMLEARCQTSKYAHRRLVCYAGQRPQCVQAHHVRTESGVPRSKSRGMGMNVDPPPLHLVRKVLPGGSETRWP